MGSYFEVERRIRDRDASGYDTKYFSEYEHALEWETLWKRLRKSFHPRTILFDAGCGTGRFSERFARLGGRVIGGDLSSESLRIAQRRTPNGLFVQTDLRPIPFPDETFAQVLCSQVITYFLKYEDAVLLLRELARILQPGGQLLISTFNLRHVARLRGARPHREVPFDEQPGCSKSGVLTETRPVPPRASMKAEFRRLICQVFSPQEIVGIWGILNFTARPFPLGRILPKRLWPLLMAVDQRIESTPAADWIAHLWLAEVRKRACVPS